MVEDLDAFELGPELSGVPFEPPDVTTEALAVRFLQTPGFHSAAFELEIAGADPEAEIIYTLDGSLPDRDAVEDPSEPPAAKGLIRRHTYRYTGPIELAPWFERPNQLSLIDTGVAESERGWREWRKPKSDVAKSVVVRAQAISGEYVSPVKSGTFFLSPSEGRRYELPVVSLSTEAAYLFNSRIGMYVVGEDPNLPNFEQRGDDWERLAYFELFDTEGERPVAQWLGLRVHGNYTRAFPQKSLRLLARKEYGQSNLEYPFFATKPNAEFKRLMLRNGGNDWGEAYFRDAAIQKLVQHLPLETQHAQPAVVFINGEYWGLHYLRDNLDEFHLEQHHGVPRESVTILETDGKLTEGSAADSRQFRAFVDKLVAGKFDSLSAVDEHIAVLEFLDYAILEAYAGNSDWPSNNFDFWRFSGPSFSTTRGPRDGRWRPLVFDIDRTLGRAKSTEANIITRAFGDEFDMPAARLFQGLIGVEEVRHEFIQRLAIHLATTFESKRVSSVVNEFTRGIEKEMPEQIARWGHPASMDEFYDYVEEAHEFAELRADTVRRDMDAFFDEVTGVAKIRIENIDPTHPPSLHGVRLSSETPGVKIEDGVWQGTVFAGVPLVLTLDGASPVDAGADVADTQAKRNIEVTLKPNAKATLRLPAASNVEAQD